MFLTYFNKIKNAKSFYILLIVFLFFLVVVPIRLVKPFMGIKTDTAVSTMQLLDLPLLENKLIESVFFLHTQPPLFNLFVGGVLKLFGDSSDSAFMILYMLMALFLILFIFLILGDLKIPLKISLPLTILFILSPGFIYSQSILLYDLPVALFLVLSVLFLYRFLKTKKLSYLIFFFTSLLIIVLTRAMFHLIWYMLILLGLLFIIRRHWKSILLIGLVPLLLIIGLYIKNFILFSQFGPSSFLGASLSRMTSLIPQEEKEQLAKKRKISSLTLTCPLSSPDNFQNYQVNINHRFRNITALNQVYKSDNNSPNFNHIKYLLIFKQHLKDGLYLIWHYPLEYLKVVGLAFDNYFGPWLWGNNFYFNFFNKYIYGDILTTAYPLFYYSGKSIPYYINTGKPIGFNFLIFILPITLIYGFYYCFFSSKKKINKILVAYLCFNIFYVMLVGNFFEVGENFRFRFYTDSFYLILFGLLIQDIFYEKKLSFYFNNYSHQK